MAPDSLQRKFAESREQYTIVLLLSLSLTESGGLPVGKHKPVS